MYFASSSGTGKEIYIDFHLSLDLLSGLPKETQANYFFERL